MWNIIKYKGICWFIFCICVYVLWDGKDLYIYDNKGYFILWKRKFNILKVFLNFDNNKLIEFFFLKLFVFFISMKMLRDLRVLLIVLYKFFIISFII